MISVRIDAGEEKRLLRYGALSGSVREALRLYLDTKKSGTPAEARRTPAEEPHQDQFHRRGADGQGGQSPLIVADSSFVIEGLLKKKELLEEDSVLTVELAIYEVADAVWKHQYVLKDLKDGPSYLAVLYGLVESGKIRVIHPGQGLMERSYSISARNDASVYDTVFVALALESGLELKTFDRRQAAMVSREAAR